MTEQMDDVELAAMTSVPVRRVVWKIRDGRIGTDERRALLDALDAVSRDHQRAEYHVRMAYLTERDEAVARAERAETALRDLLYAKQSPVDGTCPHCGSQACYEADSGIPLGVLRCKETGLAVIISTARGDIYEPLWVRARAVLEGGG